MSRLWSCSGGLRSVVNGVEYTANVTNAPSIETTLGVGTQGTGYRFNNAVGVEAIRQVYTATQGDFYFRWYDYFVALPTIAAGAVGGFRITGAYKVAVFLTTGGLLQLLNVEDAAQVDSDSSAISLGVRYRFEMRCDTTTLSATIVELRVYDNADDEPDNLIFNPSGTIDLVGLPVAVGCGNNVANATLDHIVSDMAINSTAAGGTQTSWCGAESLVYLFPNGNGDNSAWTGSDADSTDNYLLVDEVPPDTADYVQSNTSGQVDDYEMSDTPAGVEASDTINVVHVGIYGAVSDATSADPDAVIRIKSVSGGVFEESATLDFNSLTFQGPAPLPADSNYKLTLYDLPSGSTTAWTKATLDTMQVGIREAVTDTHFARVALIWVVAGHTPSAGGATYNDSVSVSRKETVSDRMTNDISPLILLSQRDGVSDGMNNNIPKDSSLNKVLTISDATGVGIYSALMLLQILSQTSANYADMQGSVGLSGDFGINGSPNNNINPNASLLSVMGVNLSGGLSLLSDLTLAEKLGLSVLGNVLIYPSLVLGRDLAFVPANISLIGGSVSLGQALGLIDVPQLDAQASLAFLQALGINLSSSLTTNEIEAVLSLAERLGLTTSAQLNSFPLVGLGERLFLLDANNANLFGTNVLNEIRGINILGGLAINDNIAIPIDLSLLTEKLVAKFGDVGLQKVLGISDSVFANMQASVSLGETTGMGNAVSQMLNAGLSINVVGSVLTISGLTVIIVKGFVFTSDSARNSLSTSDYSSTSLGSDSANSVETGDS